VKLFFFSEKHAVFSLTMIHPDDVAAAAIRQFDDNRLELRLEQFISAGLFIRELGSGLMGCFVFI